MASALDTFDFALLKEGYYESYPEASKQSSQSEDGFIFQRVKGDRLTFKVPSVFVGFPQPPSTGKDYSDFVAFADDHKILPFLFMPLRFLHRFESTLDTGDAVKTDFLFKHLFLKISSVQVFLDDVLQTSGFTLRDGAAPAAGDVTSINPFIRFTAAPAVDVVVRIEALFHNQVVLMTSPIAEGEWLSDDNELEGKPGISLPMPMQEQMPGGRFNPNFTPTPTGI